jgi:lipoprotein-anchoring transpeptidase ErfK/SrfK
VIINQRFWGSHMFRFAIVAIALLGFATPAFAANSNASLFDNLFGPGKHSSSAKHGFIRSAPEHVVITVDISTQEMIVADEDDETIFVFDVSTGRAGHATPTGSFRPVRMNEMWYSSKYENAPMPWSIFFYGGYAIHGTTDIKHLGQVASHGCVRLDPENAKLLYDLVHEVGMHNTKVELIRS